MGIYTKTSQYGTSQNGVHSQASRIVQILFFFYRSSNFSHSFHYCVLNIKVPRLFNQKTFQILEEPENAYILKLLPFAPALGGHSGGDTTSRRNHQHEKADHGFLLPGTESFRSLFYLFPKRTAIPSCERPRYDGISEIRAKYKS